MATSYNIGNTILCCGFQITVDEDLGDLYKVRVGFTEEVSELNWPLEYVSAFIVFSPNMVVCCQRQCKKFRVCILLTPSFVTKQIMWGYFCFIS